MTRHVLVRMVLTNWATLVWFCVVCCDVWYGCIAMAGDLNWYCLSVDRSPTCIGDSYCRGQSPLVELSLGGFAVALLFRQWKEPALVRVHHCRETPCQPLQITAELEMFWALVSSCWGLEYAEHGGMPVQQPLICELRLV